MSTHGENDGPGLGGGVLDLFDGIFARRCRVCGCREYDACVWIADGPPGPGSATCYWSDEDPTVCAACQYFSPEEKVRIWRGPVGPRRPRRMGERFSMAGVDLDDMVELLIPGGILESDHTLVGTSDETCSRCRRSIPGDEPRVRCWEVGDDGAVMWIRFYCDDCTAFGRAAEGTA